MQKKELIKHILGSDPSLQGLTPASYGVAWAPSNVALCKYWGKRDVELNLPVTSSLSVSLGNKGALTKIKQEGDADKYFLNGNLIDPNSKFAKRLKKFLDLFRPKDAYYIVETKTNVPIAAGFASSACGFAALVKALDKLYDWQLNEKDLSILARLGSGSACRSISEGFVEWQKGEADDGMDSYGVKLDYTWPELRIGMLVVSNDEKPISSTEAMQITVDTSPVYKDWPEKVERALANIKLALEKKDFNLLGETSENNSIAMHASMAAANPSINYSLPKTKEMIDKVQSMRKEGVSVFFTQDAGPNIQLMFLAEHEDKILKEFPDLEVVMPFNNTNAEKIILVDDNDVETGAGEKLAVHEQGKLHRAFSVCILREKDGKTEILLQQRSPIKYHSANLWTNTCCGHPRPGEDIITAGTRRLKEEMGFTVELKEIDKFHYNEKFADIDLIENEIDHVLIGYSDREDFSYELTEVQDFQWIDLEELKLDIQNNPQKYTVWLPYVVELLADQ